MPWPPRGWAPAKLPALLNAYTLAQWQLTGAGGTKQNNNRRQSTFLQKLADRYLSSLLAHVRPSTPANASTLTANTPHISFLFAFPSSFVQSSTNYISRRRSSQHVNDSTSALIVVSHASCGRRTLLHIHDIGPRPVLPVGFTDYKCIAVRPRRRFAWSI